MSDRLDDANKGAKAPRLAIDTTPVLDEEDEARANAGFDAADGAQQAGAFDNEDLHDAVGFVKGLGATAWQYARRHPFTVAYGFCGLALAVLILLIGLWDTIVIAVFVMVGAMIGQIRDGDNGIVNFFGRLFGGRH